MAGSALRTVVPPKPILMVSLRSVINKKRHKVPIVAEMILAKSKQDVLITDLHNDYHYLC